MSDKREIKNLLKNLFGREHQKKRRVIIVAYIGLDPTEFIPYPKNVEIYCWPQPGATNPQGVKSLISEGAKVKFVDKLHSKIYWVENVGCFIGSANLSSNALGENGLIEAGVYLKNISYNEIEKIIRKLKKRAVTKKELGRLEIENNNFYQNLKTKRRSKNKQASISFEDWRTKGGVSNWKLGCWEDDSVSDDSQEGKEMASKDGVSDIHEWINMSSGNWKGKWILCFKFNENTGSIHKNTIRWMRSDFSVRVKNTEKNRKNGTYQKEFPIQVIQLRKLDNRTTPPFEISKKFKMAFKKSMEELGESYFYKINPPEKLLNKIRNEIKRED